MSWAARQNNELKDAVTHFVELDGTKELDGNFV